MKTKTGGRILTEVVFTPWCNECGKSISGSDSNKKVAEETLKNHLEFCHPTTQKKVLIVTL